MEGTREGGREGRKEGEMARKDEKKVWKEGMSEELCCYYFCTCVDVMRFVLFFKSFFFL